MSIPTVGESNNLDLLPYLKPIVSRVRQDITWKKTGIQTKCQRKQPVTPELLGQHIRDIYGLGVCPMQAGSTATKLALLDLDDHDNKIGWEGIQYVGTTVFNRLTHLGHSPIAFRSSGGKGIHIFLLWDTPQDAYSVRLFLANDVLDHLGFKNGTKGIFGKEIEIFPKQDSVPLDGAGSQFILPLYNKSAPLSDPLLGFMPLTKTAIREIDFATSPAVPFIEREIKPPKEKKEITAPDLLELKKMLSVIDPDCNYDTWLKSGMAVHSATNGSEEGLDLWDEWSSTALIKYPGRETIEAKWRSFSTNRDVFVTIGSLKKIAAEHGYQEDYSMDFEDVSSDMVKNEGGHKLERYKPIRADEFIKRPRVKWLIKGILPEGEGMTFGASGCGKTFAILDMACHIALGKNWNGNKVKRGHVVYICAEGGGGFINRLQAWATYYKVSLKDVGDYLTIIPDTPDFRDEKDVRFLAEQINKYNKGTVLVIVDTFAQVTAGADENSSKDVGLALRHAKLLGTLTHSTYHLIHHAGKDENKGARGSSVMKGQLDCMFHIFRSGDKHTFWVDKLKDDKDGFGYDFNLRRLIIDTDDEGDVIESCIVEYHGKSDGKKQKTRKLSFWQGLVLNAATELSDEFKGPVPIERVAAKAAEKALYSPGPDTKKPKRDSRQDSACRALEKLVADGKLYFENNLVIIPQFRNSSQIGNSENCGIGQPVSQLSQQLT